MCVGFRFGLVRCFVAIARLWWGAVPRCGVVSLVGVGVTALSGAGQIRLVQGRCPWVGAWVGAMGMQGCIPSARAVRVVVSSVRGMWQGE